MKKGISGAALHGSKRVKRISREVRVKNLKTSCDVDIEALSTLMVMANPHKNAHLFYKVCNSLVGFDAHLQNEIVEALALYYTGEAFTITCIEHVDQLLVNLYRVFDRELLNVKKM